MRIFWPIILILLITLSAYASDLTEISDKICQGLKTDDEKIVAIREHVFNKMKPNVIPLEETKTKSLKEMYDIGVGWCDHKATIFCLLIREQGLTSRIIYLMAEDMHSSPHTIAEVKLEKRWVVVDVGNNYDFRNSRGELATRSDMASDFNIIMSKVKFGDESYWRMFARNCIQGSIFEP